ncbi:MAG TPA: helix-turn-helix domain-containing protein [Jatrophihabitans sp.]|nr:helix-turn-helix domain-containing protein [Jatrophihabitans sp.]
MTDGVVTWTDVAAEVAEEAGGLDPALLGDFLPALVTAATSGASLARAEVQRCRGRGERAARAGTALPALVDLHLSAARRLWRLLPAVAARADAAAVAAAAERILAALDDAIPALAAGYAQARRVVVREQVSARREFVDDLLGGQGDVAGLLGRAPGFGLDLARPHAVAVVQAEASFSDASPLPGVIERAVREAVNAETGALAATKDARLVIVCPIGDQDALDQLTGALTALLGVAGAGDETVRLRRRLDVGAWRAGVGRAGVGPSGVLASYDEARNALMLAGRLGLRRQVVLAADMLVYQVLLRDRPAITDLVTTVLGPLRNARGGASPLIDTLAGYYDAGGNAAQAARALHLSVRALTYRLDRVRQLTGHDPTRSTERFTLHAAVLGARLLDWPATERS